MTSLVQAPDPEDAVRALLVAVGENPHREGLVDTPRRVCAALAELTAGYQIDVGKLLEVTFAEAHDQMIVVRGVDFTSLCEHHLMPFVGTATVAYIPRPGGGVVGLSKLGRVVDAYARRLQVQERLTDQIAEAVDDALHPLGVGVVVTARHLCMSARGAKVAGEMVTSRMIGVLLDKPEARAELLALHREA